MAILEGQNLEVIKTALTATSYQIRITFTSTKNSDLFYTYGFQGHVDSRVDEEKTVRIVYNKSRYGGDPLGLMSTTVVIKDLEKTLTKDPLLIPTSYEVVEKDYDPLFSKTSGSQNSLMKEVRGLVKVQPNKKLSPDFKRPTPKTSINRQGWLVDSKNWVYEPTSNTIFGVISSGVPARFFYSQMLGENPSDFYHVKILGRTPTETLSKEEFLQIVSKVKKERPTRKK